MKKQYRYGEATFGKYWLKIYHDGELVETKEYWNDDLFYDLIDKLEIEGYTYGFTETEVENAKKKYEHILANVLRKE